MVQKQPGDSPPPVMFFHIQRTNIGSQVATAVIIMIDQADTCHDLPFFLLHDIPLGDSGLLPDSLPDTVPVHLRRNPPLFVEPAGGFVQAVRAVPQRRQTQHVH